SQEKDTAQLAAERALFGAGHHAGGVEDSGNIAGIPPQMQPTPGLPHRAAVARRAHRVPTR
ncbi:MAG: ABC transporter ATP-binding protein, partial [Thermocrispum sp.]